MISNHEEDEFVAVRVQDPRVQNEGSWNSYVDFKIFLHTNSKAFTAKTSCVRRRYSEFVWLRKKMQKNAGLVPVPELPGKSFFSFSNEDFLEKRRKGLQAFLDRVVHTTVCLSDSQLHLFLQTQLPIGHILDCVQGHTPYSVTDAILTYASSNRGLAQAQEEDAVKDASLTVSYESMESPAPHPPCPPGGQTPDPELLERGEPDPADGFVEVGLQDADGSGAAPAIRISQSHHHLEAVVERRGPPRASFYLGGSLDDARSLSPADHAPLGGRQIQTPAVVHSAALDGEDEAAGTAMSAPEARPDTREEETSSEPEECEATPERCVATETPPPPPSDDAAGAETPTKDTPQEEERRRGDAEGESGEDDSQSLTSDGSIVTVSDEEEEEEEQSACEEAEVSAHPADDYTKTPPAADAHWSAVAPPGVAILDLRINGRLEAPRDAIGKSPGVNSAAGDGDLTENSDISILESSSAPGLADGRCAEDLAALSFDAADESQEVEVN